MQIREKNKNVIIFKKAVVLKKERHKKQVKRIFSI